MMLKVLAVIMLVGAVVGLQKGARSGLLENQKFEVVESGIIDQPRSQSELILPRYRGRRNVLKGNCPQGKTKIEWTEIKFKCVKIFENSQK